ncbi:MAG TPA: double zinc ribbon domain-containing protein, partial [Pyrinomonadaceae bacterium]
MARLTNSIDRLFDAALALVYPQACAACGLRGVERRADWPACAECWASTHIFTGDETLCWKCGAPAGGEVPDEVKPNVRCRRCDAEAFDAARACGVYEGALRAAVLNLKREPFAPPRLSHLLRDASRRPPLDAATLVIPVPLHRRREQERGFNQAALLASSLAKSIGLPFDAHSLTRLAHSERHRAGMDALARRESVADAFAVTRPRLVRDENILLIDDVFTTGATASACARAL